jgi:mycofactocin precursor
VVAFRWEVGKEVGVHGVVNTSCQRSRPSSSNRYAQSMENEEIVEVSDEASDEAGIDGELLIEEISIDGMCGVY